MIGPSSRPPASGRNVPCPCGSGRKWKRCCGAASPWLPPPGKTLLVTATIPGVPTDAEEGAVEVTPERMTELLAAFDAVERGETDPGCCPLCALQRRWAAEDAEPA